MEGMIFIIQQVVRIFLAELILNQEYCQNHYLREQCNECEYYELPVGTCSSCDQLLNANKYMFLHAMGQLPSSIHPLMVSFPSYWQRYAVTWGQIPLHVMIDGDINNEVLMDLKGRIKDYCERHNIKDILDPH